MKKTLCTILAMLMLVSLVGCKIESTADIGSEKDEVVSATDEQIVEDPVDEPAEELAEEPEEKLEIGAVDGNTYRNEYADITFTKPEKWMFASKEELAELMELSLDMVADENEYAKQVAELSSVYDMMATSADLSSNVQIMFENLAVMGVASLPVNQYVSLVATQLEATYAQMGATCTISDVETIELGGQEYAGVRIAVKINDTEMEQCYACKKVGSYVACVVFTTNNVEEGVDSLFGYFG